MSTPKYAPIVETWRGPIVESIHYGSIVVVDPSGGLVACTGDPDAVVYLRSSSKPFQILPLVEMGGMERFGLTERELAVMCASHTGTDDHVHVVSGIQKKLGVSIDQLMCGMHMPTDPLTAERMFTHGEETTPLRHNCSGKHTGMLAQALLQGFPLEDYINPQHPVQRVIIRTFSKMTGVPVEQIDPWHGWLSPPPFSPSPCALQLWLSPAWQIPLHCLSRVRSALRRIFSAMTANPDMVSGPDTFDTNLMTVGRGKILTKGGAEGYQAVSVLADGNRSCLRDHHQNFRWRFVREGWRASRWKNRSFRRRPRPFHRCG